ncbi:MAG TPA: hypothetical protein PLG47_04270 [Candidatus Dojkabacteria bacterium]|nr:hypothetical protein [Candidatus Dojkabacteria bacterium]
MTIENKIKSNLQEPNLANGGWRIKPELLKEIQNQIPDDEYWPVMEVVERILLVLIGEKREDDNNRGTK